MILLSAFLSLRITDIIDMLFVAYLLYQSYSLLKDTVAVNIFIAIFGMFLFWLLVKAFNMELTGAILRQVFSIGSIALVVLFQPEIRRFLVNLGKKYRTHKWFGLDKLFSTETDNRTKLAIKSITMACTHMSATKTGALIVITRTNRLDDFVETGDIINGVISSRLLENIFFKNTPLHDGAVITLNDKIYAARCILPVSDNRKLPANLGLRHRAALGITETTDALVVIVSEETGYISIADHGVIHENIAAEQLEQQLEILLTKD
jgi:uncharacterized protein (TIGR00159 family)